MGRLLLGILLCIWLWLDFILVEVLCVFLLVECFFWFLLWICLFLLCDGIILIFVIFKLLFLFFWNVLKFGVLEILFFEVKEVLLIEDVCFWGWIELFVFLLFLFVLCLLFLFIEFFVYIVVMKGCRYVVCDMLFWLLEFCVFGVWLGDFFNELFKFLLLLKELVCL